jgi:hypothetical protein
VRGHAGRRFWWCNYGVALLGQFGCCCLVVVVLPNCGVDGRSERSRSRNHGGVSVEKRKHILGRIFRLINRTERPVAFCGFSQASITGTSIGTLHLLGAIKTDFLRCSPTADTGSALVKWITASGSGPRTSGRGRHSVINNRGPEAVVIAAQEAGVRLELLDELSQQRTHAHTPQQPPHRPRPQLLTATKQKTPAAGRGICNR